MNYGKPLRFGSFDGGSFRGRAGRHPGLHNPQGISRAVPGVKAVSVPHGETSGQYQRVIASSEPQTTEFLYGFSLYVECLKNGDLEFPTSEEVGWIKETADRLGGEVLRESIMVALRVVQMQLKREGAMNGTY